MVMLDRVHLAEQARGVRIACRTKYGFREVRVGQVVRVRSVGL